jgi:hypothetical protein
MAFSATDDPKLVASSKKTVSVGERFKLVYEINADGSRFTAPNFGKLQRLSGPSKSSNSSVQYINGNYQQSYSQTFTFIMVANSEGEINIPPASIKVKGKTIVSNTLKIKVVKGSNNRSTTQNRNSKQSEVLQKDDVYIKTIVSNRKPYLGEQIIVTNRIYTKVPISNLSFEKVPSFQGFWSKSLNDEKNQLKQSTQIIDGVEYIVADISKFAVFPQKSGEITIEGSKMQCVAQIKSNTTQRRSRDPFESFFNDPFFNRNMKNVEVTLNSKPIKITVKELPQKGKPESFTGAVGRFSFSSSLDNDSISANDAINISLKLIGAGNLELVNTPEISFPSDFESYDPKINNNIQTSLNGISGSKKIEYLAIARNPGDFIIKPIEFSYFNPSDKKYHSISAGPYKIHVKKGSNGSSGITYSSSAQEDIKFIGKDIHHIKQNEIELKPIGVFLFNTPLYFILLILPIFILIVFVLLFRNFEKRKGNIQLMKTRKANKVAKSKLQKAEKLMNLGKNKEFYDEIAQAIWGYISDKFHIMQADMSIENVKETIKLKGIDEEIINGFVNTLNNVEFARFAPGDASHKMKNIYEESLSTISKAEKALK